MLTDEIEAVLRLKDALKGRVVGQDRVGVELLGGHQAVGPGAHAQHLGLGQALAHQVEHVSAVHHAHGAPR